TIAATACDYLNAGTVSAAGGAGQIDFSASYIETASAVTSATGGGHIRIDGGDTGQLDSSGRIDASGAPGGTIDLCGKDVYLIGASVTPGAGGSLVLDPKDLVVSAAPAGQFPQFSFVNPNPGGKFGAQVVTLPNGNEVVTDPWANNNAGAVYL